MDEEEDQHELMLDPPSDDQHELLLDPPSDEQMLALLDFMEQYPFLVSMRGAKFATLWIQIARQLNAMENGAVQTHLQWRQFWLDRKLDFKLSFGDSPDEIETDTKFNEIERRMLSLGVLEDEDDEYEDEEEMTHPEDAFSELFNQEEEKIVGEEEEDEEEEVEEEEEEEEEESLPAMPGSSTAQESVPMDSSTIANITQNFIVIQDEHTEINVPTMSTEDHPLVELQSRNGTEPQPTLDSQSESEIMVTPKPSTSTAWDPLSRTKLRSKTNQGLKYSHAMRSNPTTDQTLAARLELINLQKKLVQEKLATLQSKLQREEGEYQKKLKREEEEHQKKMEILDLEIQIKKKKLNE